MSKTSSLINTPDGPELCHFQIRENCHNMYVVVRVTLFINADTKDPQIKHFPCPK